MLRPQQKELEEVKNEIKAGRSKINKIYTPWACGAGKSLAPVILADLLIKPNQKQIVVVPRSALQIQGEQGFNSPYYKTDKVARIASNSGDPFRGCDSCFTTFQAIGANPEKWIKVCEDYDIQLILDEFHHTSEHGEWIKPIRKMEKLSSLSVFMTGTIFRGDNSRIPFVPYNNANEIDYSDTEFRKWIFYTQKQSLADGNVLPYQTVLIDGSGSYIDKENIERSFSTLGDKSDHLRTAFQTEFAFQLLNLTIRHYLKYRKSHKWAKLLIVSPDIATGEKYLSYLKDSTILKVAIATSADTANCKESIKRYKKDNERYDSFDCLITVGVAYEGFDCPEASHLALLTLIRSVQWLTQCLARVTRKYLNKKQGYVFGPQDSRVLEVLKIISAGKILSASNNEVKEIQKKKESPEGSDWSNGIQALNSEAHIEGVIDDYEPAQKPQPKETQSEIEIRLRKQINSVVNKIVGQQNSGNIKVKERIFWLRVKQIANYGRDKETGKIKRKPLKEMTVKELTAVWEFAQNHENEVDIF